MDEKVDKQSILEKLWSLSPDRLAEVEDFVDFLLYRQVCDSETSFHFVPAWCCAWPCRLSAKSVW